MKTINLYALVQADTKEFVGFISGSDDKEVINQTILYHKDIIKSINDVEKLQPFLDKVKNLSIVRIGSINASNIESGITPEFTTIYYPNYSFWEDVVILRKEIIEKDRLFYGN